MLVDGESAVDQTVLCHNTTLAQHLGELGDFLLGLAGRDGDARAVEKSFPAFWNALDTLTAEAPA